MASVSVIIPVFNRLETLERALRSLQAQTFQGFEVVVVDDHSTKDIFSITQRYRARYLKTRGKGVSAARNTGIRSSTAEWIAFLDSDDEWLAPKLEMQLSYVANHQSCDFVHTNELWIRNGLPVKQNSNQRKMGGRIFSQCAWRCLISPSSVLVRKSLLDKTGLFDEDFAVCEDFDLWLRITSSFDIGFIKESLVIKHGGHEDQLSMQFHSMDLWRARALVKHLKNPNLTIDERVELRASLAKKCEILLNGFEKHRNFQYLAEVQGYKKSLLEAFQLSAGG